MQQHLLELHNYALAHGLYALALRCAVLLTICAGASFFLILAEEIAAARGTGKDSEKK